VAALIDMRAVAAKRLPASTCEYRPVFNQETIKAFREAVGLSGCVTDRAPSSTLSKTHRLRPKIDPRTRQPARLQVVSRTSERRAPRSPACRYREALEFRCR
jgi:hypothetical protein